MLFVAGIPKRSRSWAGVGQGKRAMPFSDVIVSRGVSGLGSVSAGERERVAKTGIGWSELKEREGEQGGWTRARIRKG